VKRPHMVKLYHHLSNCANRTLFIGDKLNMGKFLLAGLISREDVIYQSRIIEDFRMNFVHTFCNILPEIGFYSIRGNRTL